MSLCRDRHLLLNYTTWLSELPEVRLESRIGASSRGVLGQCDIVSSSKGLVDT